MVINGMEEVAEARGTEVAAGTITGVDGVAISAGEVLVAVAAMEIIG